MFKKISRLGILFAKATSLTAIDVCLGGVAGAAVKGMKNDHGDETPFLSEGCWSDVGDCIEDLMDEI